MLVEGKERWQHQRAAFAGTCVVAQLKVAHVWLRLDGDAVQGSDALACRDAHGYASLTVVAELTRPVVEKSVAVLAFADVLEHKRDLFVFLQSKGGNGLDVAEGGLLVTLQILFFEPSECL